jgi:cytochrome c
MSRRAGWVVLVVLPVLALPLCLARADAARGERVFQRCYACHSLDADETTLPGPSLRGVLGRRAGTLPGFLFSPAMVAAGARGVVWSRETLDAYLADPLAFVPGTQMPPPGVPDARDRADVIDYLLTRSGGAR